jgi:hypothetical protein
MLLGYRSRMRDSLSVFWEEIRYWKILFSSEHLLLTKGTIFYLPCSALLVCFRFSCSCLTGSDATKYEFGRPMGVFLKTWKHDWVASHWTSSYCVRFQVLTVASMKFRIVFWDVLPCKIIVDQRFRRTCCLHLQGWSLISRHPRRQFWSSYWINSRKYSFALQVL